MKKITLPLFVLLFVWSFAQAQQPLFSVTAKTNYTFAVTSNDFGEPGLLFADGFLGVPISERISQSPNQDNISEAGFAFEIGVDARLLIAKRLSLTTGIFFQQLRYKVNVRNIFFFDPLSSNPFSIPNNSKLTSSRRLDYFKIPFGVEYALVQDKLFLQGGLWGGMVYATNVSTKDIDNREIPLVFTDNEGNIIRDNTSPINSMLMGLQLGLRYNFFKKMSVVFDYSRGLNNLLKSPTFNKEKINSFAFGLSWQIN